MIFFSHLLSKDKILYIKFKKKILFSSRGDLENILFNNDFAHIGHIKGVRWLLSKERALKALVKNLKVVVLF